MKLAEMRENKGRLADQLKAFVNDTGDAELTSEQRAQWDQMNEDYNRTDQAIQRMERLESIDADTNGAEQVHRSTIADENRSHAAPTGEPQRDQPSAEDRALALQAWSMANRQEPTERQLIACKRVGVNWRNTDIELNLMRTREYRQMQARALGTGPAPDGGATVPEEFVYELEAAMIAVGGLRPVASIMRTSGGAAMPWPTVNDTANNGEWLSENTQTASDEDPAFGQVVYGAHKASSKMVRVAVELLQDSAFNMAAELGRLLGERLGRLTNIAYTTGSGTSEPRGLITDAPTGHTSGTVGAIDSDDLIDMLHSVDPSYRNSMAAWQMHDSIAAAVRKLKDSEGRFLWEPRLTAGTPDLLLGFPVTYNQNMASTIATSNDVMTFGDHTKYKIRDVIGIRLRRLTELYADYDQEGFVAFLRTDGALLDAGTGPVKKLTVQ